MLIISLKIINENTISKIELKINFLAILIYKQKNHHAGNATLKVAPLLGSLSTDIAPPKLLI
jgi:hypothetical protein